MLEGRHRELIRERTELRTAVDKVDKTSIHMLHAGARAYV